MPRSSFRAFSVAAAAMLGLIAPALLAAPAVADTASDNAVTWAVSPADQTGPDGRSWVEAELDPGAFRAEHLALRNLSDADVTFGLTAADGYLTPTGRFSMLPSTSPSTAAGTWIDVADTVSVPARSSVVVPYTITVPPDAEPGDHAAGIAASIRSEGSDGAATVSVESRVGFRVMTRVTGDVTAALVSSATGEYRIAWNPFTPGGIRIAYTLHNTGNVRLTVTATTEYRGRPLDAEETGADTPLQLLPGDTRTVHLTVPDVWPLGAMTLPLEAQYSVIPPDGSDTPLEATTTSVIVWAMPWPQLAVILAVLLLGCGILGDRVRRRRALVRLLNEAREAGRREAPTIVTRSSEDERQTMTK
ncbi:MULTISPECIES: hypothetical protein [unclassified Rathayibacter]|uniref:hypothetical protein n=1 Tax=unclassified Rathayibacter TaxID=2609250 RepID=UPI000CE8D1F0|nr:MULTISPECIES: hypothetical protein [unclassified Rathayibacter]PPG08363.1 hypothetical protein C5C26_08050 [Rathayibacter sp. AY2B1]PPG72904.1 hypothetical protein C5C59_05345 [Rathayibacter sp. AY1F4]